MGMNWFTKGTIFIIVSQCWHNCFHKILWVVLWWGCGRQRGSGVCLASRKTTELRDKAFWFLLGWDVFGSNLADVWERTSFARLKSCASVCFKKLCSTPLFFQKHNKLFSGVVHIPPSWVTGTCQLAKSCDASRGKKNQGPLWWLFVPSPSERPIVGNICCSSLLNIFSLSFEEHPPSSSLVPTTRFTSQFHGECVIQPGSISVWLKEGHVTEVGPMALILGLFISPIEKKPWYWVGALQRDRTGGGGSWSFCHHEVLSFFSIKKHSKQTEREKREVSNHIL